VLKRKDDRRFHAWTVAKGFSQVPSIDFTENFAPVVNDATFWLTLMATIIINDMVLHRSLTLRRENIILQLLDVRDVHKQ
jgi:hypothetical protein